MAQQGTYDRLMVDILAQTENAKPAKVKTEAVSQDFKVGAVAKRTPAKMVETTAPVTQTIHDALIALEESIEQAKTAVDKEIISKFSLGEYTKAKNLKYAYRALKHALEDIEDACELIDSIV